VKKIFNYLDTDMDGKICVGEFKLLSEDVWRNIDPLQHYLSNIQNASKKKETS
jgi:Ca2+-binding EF-hand superfamily protein